MKAENSSSEHADHGNTKKRIERIAKRRPYVPVHDDPITELKRLVREHQACTKTSVALTNMSGDRVHRESGEAIPCLLPDDRRVGLQLEAESLKKSAKRLEQHMLRQLETAPIWQHFMANVPGCGPVTAAYLVAYVDIHKARKPSNLRRYLGLARIDGKLERRTKGCGPKSAGGSGTFNRELRTRLFIFGGALRRAVTTKRRQKYLDIWNHYKHRAKSCDPPKKRPDRFGMWRMMDVFAEDLYIIWRAIEGLPVWPSYYAAKLGYEHGGKICVNAPRMLTLEEAIELVGDVSAEVL